jgi:hypothetical protein
MTYEEPRQLFGGHELLTGLNTFLPADPDAVVRAFAEYGGNSSGESAAVFQEWVASLGADDVEDIKAMVAALRDKDDLLGGSGNATLRYRGGR